MKKSFLPIILGLASGVAGAQAASTPYTQSSAFFAALANPIYAPSQTETYESYVTNTAFAENGTMGNYTYSGFPVYADGSVTGRADQRDQAGSNVGFYSVNGGLKSLGAFFTPTAGSPAGDYFFNGESFTIALPAGTRAIGLFFNISAAVTPNATDLFINTAMGNATNGGSNYDTMVGNNDGSNGGLGTKNLFFVGLISDTPFTSAQIGVEMAGLTGFNVDNLTTATPEPTSLGLLGLGAMAFAGYSRRRQVR